jgi:hypothetical protein
MMESSLKMLLTFIIPHSLPDDGELPQDAAYLHYSHSLPDDGELPQDAPHPQPLPFLTSVLQIRILHTLLYKKFSAYVSYSALLQKLSTF